MASKEDFEEMLESIDAAVFTGDTLHDSACITMLQEYIERRETAIEEWTAEDDEDEDE